MQTSPLRSITVIFSPYHVGIRDYEVGAGPGHIRDHGLVSALQRLGVAVREVEVEIENDADGDIGRSFEVFRHTAKLVTAARNDASFPIVISGNCGASVGVLAGLTGSSDLKDEEVGCIFLDAHDDYNIPDTVMSGYFDSMVVAIMAGQCWKALLSSIPGYKPLDLQRFVHCGLRDLNDMERARVTEAGYPIIWGSADTNVDFVNELTKVLDERSIDPALVHVDLDCLSKTVGKVNKFEPLPGGLTEDDLTGCLTVIPTKVKPLSLTVASFDPTYDNDGRITKVAISAIACFVKALLDNAILTAKS